MDALESEFRAQKNMYLKQLERLKAAQQKCQESESSVEDLQQSILRLENKIQEARKAIVLRERALHQPFRYRSPLLAFRAYRTSPSFTKQPGISVLSPTWSTGLTAHQPLCPYSLTGKCNDAKCRDQHVEAAPTKKLVLVRLLS